MYVQLMLKRMPKSGFTIVELLIAIVVIAVLATITVVSYNGITERSRNATILSDITQVAKLIEQYNAINGSYPVTSATTIAGSATNSTTLTDSGCPVGTSTSAWVPNLTNILPQSDHNAGGGAGAGGGCYMYQSDGKSYILSAWNLLKTAQTSTRYRRLGFREIFNAPFYYCNHTNIGGSSTGTYVITSDYYKYSYTISNINWCNETPPVGA